MKNTPTPAPRPTPSYPRQLPLADGRWVTVRPLDGSDWPAIQLALADTPRDALYRRFLAPPPPSRLLREAVGRGSTQRFLLGAFRGHRLAAVAEWDRIDDRTAEFAIIVGPAVQRQGLGRALLSAVIADARAVGFRTLQATYFRSNTAIDALLADSGLPMRRRPQGNLMEATLTLRPAQPQPLRPGAPVWRPPGERPDPAGIR